MNKSSLIIGRQPLIEALQTGRGVDKILLQNTASGDTAAHIRRLAKEHNIPVQTVPAEKLSALTRNNHQGVIAYAALVYYRTLQEVLDEVQNRGAVPLFLLLDGITDVRNIGAIARTALCCGAQAIIIPDKGVAALNEEALKSSAGALQQVQVCRVSSLMKAVDELHAQGIAVYASQMKAPKQLHELSWAEPSAVVMGSEDKGVFPPLMKICDQTFRIPMAGNFESLNVSVAAGMILYEAMRQRVNVNI